MENTIELRPLRPATPRAWIEETVSVIIPTRNAGAGFRDLLEGIRKQRKVRNTEILVLDSASTDDTVALARAFDARVIPIEPASFSHGGTRNRAGEEAIGEFLVFTVQDAVPLNPYWLFKLVSPMLDDPELKAVSTRQVPPPQGKIPLYALWSLEDLDRNIYTPLGCRDLAIQACAHLRDEDIPMDRRRVLSFFDNVCSCIRKDYFLENRFSALVNAEDMDYGYRLLKSGNRFGFIHSTGVVHYHDRGPQHILKLNYLGVLGQHDILGVQPPFYFQLKGVRLADLDLFFSDYLAALSHILLEVDQEKEWLHSYCRLVMNGNGHGRSAVVLEGSMAEALADLQTAVDSCLPDTGPKPGADRQEALWSSLLPFQRSQMNWLKNSGHAPREEIGRALVCLTARFFGHHLAGYVLANRETDPELCARLNESLELGICRGIPLRPPGKTASPDAQAAHALPMDGERFLPWMADPRISYEHLHRYRFVREFARGKRLLDLGCGEGYGSRYLAEVARSVTAVDIDANTVAHASACYRRENLAYCVDDVRQGSVLENESFDMVVCFEVLEHVREQDELLATVARVLKEDGLAVLSTPNKDASIDPNPFHVGELNQTEFERLIGRHFPCARFYHQLDVAGSAIVPFEGGAKPEISRISRTNGQYGFSGRQDIPHEYSIALVAHRPEAIRHPAMRSFCMDYSKSLDHYYLDQIRALREELDKTVAAQEISLQETQTRALQYAHEASVLEMHMDEALLLAAKAHETVSRMAALWGRLGKQTDRSLGHTLCPEDLAGINRIFDKLDTALHTMSTLLNPKRKRIGEADRP